MKTASWLLLMMVLVVSCALGQELRSRPQYTLRAGDVVELQYRYTPELNQTVTVLPDGFVNLNLVGNVKVSDLTLDRPVTSSCKRRKHG